MELIKPRAGSGVTVFHLRNFPRRGGPRWEFNIPGTAHRISCNMRQAGTRLCMHSGGIDYVTRDMCARTYVNTYLCAEKH
jgi:hypothetical protein